MKILSLPAEDLYLTVELVLRRINAKKIRKKKYSKTGQMTEMLIVTPLCKTDVLQLLIN